MPIIHSNYNPPLLFKNGQWSTIYSGLFRKVQGVAQTRERITLTDGDFMDLDWSFSTKTSTKVVILLHGLEGHAQRPYITGPAKQFNLSGYDACAVNYRACSGETNTLFRSYHSGATDDLDAIINHILETKKYTEIYLKGISLGGNLVLKYLGERASVPKEIKAGMAISVPCSLHSSLIELLTFKNVLYAQRFKNHLIAKLILKQQKFPDKISDSEITSIKTLKDFDDVYTSRAHGFIDALDYYKQCSSLQFLPNIKTPTLIVNAKNDTFLGPECYPYQEAESNNNLFLEVPKYGGHVGFYGVENITYTERKVIKFLQESV
ncbi:MAG: alpha/beta hydrolase [Flavobacteriaceae bacterium]|nr:MAG: alpha/beta hydrolase [Flavobacteriaceae bacterium]